MIDGKLKYVDTKGYFVGRFSETDLANGIDSAKRPGDLDYQIQKFCCQDEFDTYLAPNYMRRIRLFPTKEGAEEDAAKDKVIARIRDRIDRIVWDRYDLVHLIAIQELLDNK